MRMHRRGCVLLAALCLLATSCGSTSSPSGPSSMSGMPSAGGATITGTFNAIARTIVVDGVTVSVPASAAIRRGDANLAFGNLMTGEHVHVSGMFGGSTLVASEIKVQGMDD